MCVRNECVLCLLIRPAPRTQSPSAMTRTSFFEVKVLDADTKEPLCLLDKVEPCSTVADIKSLFHKSYPHWYPARQALKLDPKEKSLRDDEILQNLPVGTSATMYFRDLGPQLGWTMVFVAECIGPLLAYLLFYFRVPYIYSHRYAFTSSPHPVVPLACACHTFHYMKRLIETVFVHRFAHGTMPLRTIVRNCAYYWGFSAWLAYYINHPLYTPPSFGELQVNYAFIMFVVCELGNFSIHVTLRADGKLLSSFIHLELKGGIHQNVYIDRGAEGFLCRLRTPSRGCFSLYPAQTTHTRSELGCFVHITGVRSDEHLGQREAQSLQQGVQGLSQPPGGHHPSDSLTGTPNTTCCSTRDRPIDRCASSSYL
uniref:very-long-chain enoyl-CoA reductase isoform X2 n=1 Tax=Scatophagus argus TaxID=75038 RepID=UPI001ED83C60|nr:very-long-chain enoyl-CoA reductase isoform X2 [Scatophagus argus]